MCCNFRKHMQTIDCKKNGRSVRDVTRRFLERILESLCFGFWSGHSQIIENGQKGGRWVESGNSSSNPPVTHVATPLIMQKFKA